MEDFIFDDDVDEVGAEVEAHCPKCKADTTHVVISKYEDEIRRVQCNPCGDVHGYRKPKGESEEEPEPTPKKKAAKAKPTYDQIIAKSKKPPRNYAIDEYFKESEIVAHPKFGVGVVSENIGDDKIEVTFKENGKEEKRVLVHNRKGLTLPVSMLRPLALPSQKPAKGGKAAPQPKAAARPAAKKPVAAPPKAKAAARPAAKKPERKPAAAARKPAAKVKVKAKAAVKKHASAPARPKAKPVKKVKKSR
jgi:hypothetical protein